MEISETNRRAKYYSLTRAGRKALSAEAANWERLSTASTGSVHRLILGQGLGLAGLGLVLGLAATVAGTRC